MAPGQSFDTAQDRKIQEMLFHTGRSIKEIAYDSFDPSFIFKTF